MDFISSYAGKDGLPALVTIVAVILILMFAIKKGWISFKGHGLEVGIADTERAVLRQQMQFMNTVLDGTISDIPVRLREGLHYYRTKYVISKVKDLLEETIIYNHIEDEPNYISLKQEIAYNLVLKLTEDEFFKKPEFKQYIYDLIERLIKRFVTIRKVHYGTQQ